MTNILDFYANTNLVKNLVSNLEKQKTQQLVTGLNDTPRSITIAGIFASSKKNIFVAIDTQYHANQLYNDLVALLDENQVIVVENEESLATQMAISSFEAGLSRSQAINHIVSGQEPKIIVAPISFIKKRVADKQTYLDAQITLKVGQRISFDELKNQLFNGGYVSKKIVEKPGDYSVRGGIVDIFPSDAGQPVRLDFFDDEIDTIKFFDSNTQKSLSKLKEISIIPTSDFVLSAEQLQAGKKKLQKAFEDYREEMKGNDKKLISQYFLPLMERIDEGQKENELQMYSQFFLEDKTVLDLLDTNTVLVVDEYAKILDQEKIQAEKNSEYLLSKLGEFASVPGLEIEIPVSAQIKTNQLSKVFLSNLQRGFTKFTFDSLENVATRPMEQFFSQIPALKTELQGYAKRNFTTVLLASTPERAHSLQTTLSDFGVNLAITEQVLEGTAQIQISSLLRGFEIPQEKLAVITESELFAQVKRRRPPKRQTFSNAERISSYNEINEGDFVVHVNHGIARYEGIKSIETQGSKQDYLQLAFSNNARIYVPVTQLNLVQKYIGANDGSPKVSSLTSGEWAKTKRKVSQSIEDIADDLIELYAKRASQTGFAFSEDTERQKNFDEDFAYTETDDQLTSIREIKNDMQSNKPMDRLLVGDVGFGKTEVAMRAAFKAVNDGKQVAFLAPTTILTQQHYQTFVERFVDFPEIRIGSLSRFATPSENKKVIKKLAAHELDIVVGTHRLLSKDVEFADLGLLVIDEEQRFGVKHKEKIKQMRANVDVLTLTATPIPRTLNMSLMGARDLSVLETPPVNRYPIQTYVLENNWPVIADAIEKEISRGGQVFFVHNKVSDIERVVAMIQDLVPGSRVGYIHGQMAENQVEDMLVSFLENQYDVLVTTTIIETGVDIANANTIIVENAQNFGLSSLYQLRGRVGRSNRLAYAYFLYPPEKQPNEDAQKRLEAIRDFTELGSGFKLAMRDLSIRGAGDILGKQQHGFINSIGYELFQELLSDAVEAKKTGVAPKTKTNAEIIISIPAFLPDDYISDGMQKIEMYQRIRQSKTKEQFDEVREDLVDRFGKYPDEVDNLFDLVSLKIQADQANVENLRQNKKEFILTFNKEQSQKLAGEKIFKQLSHIKYKARVSAQDDKLIVTLISDENVKSSVQEITKFLTHINIEEDKNETR